MSKVFRITRSVVGHSWVVTGEYITAEEDRLTGSAHAKAQEGIAPSTIIKAASAVIGYNSPNCLDDDPPRPLQIRVGPILGKADRPVPKWIDGYYRADGAVRPRWRAMPNAAHAVSGLLYLYAEMTADWSDDPMPPAMVDAALWAIEEYGLAVRKWNWVEDEMGTGMGDWSKQVFEYGQWWAGSLDELTPAELLEWLERYPDVAKRLSANPDWRARHPDLVRGEI